jgi:hypothetical protein
MRSVLSSLILLALSAPALADPIPVSEPGTLALLGLGVGLAVWLKGRRK